MWLENSTVCDSDVEMLIHAARKQHIEMWIPAVQMQKFPELQCMWLENSTVCDRDVQLEI